MRKTRKKREKFSILLMKSLSVALAVSVFAGIVFCEYLMGYIRSKAREEINDSMTNLLAQITQYHSENRMDEFGAYLSIYGSSYDIVLEFTNGFVQIVPQYVDGCSAASALIDENNNTVASSKMVFSTSLIFGKDDKENGFYVCDNEKLNMPEADEFYRQYRELMKNKYSWVGVHLDSVYVNKEKKIAIPHRGYFEIEVIPEHERGAPFIIYDESKIERKTEEIKIDLKDSEGFELIELNGISGKEYPKYAFANFHGTPVEEYDEISENFKFHDYKSYCSGGYYGIGNFSFSVSAGRPVFLDGKQYFFETSYIVNAANKYVLKLFWIVVLSFTGIMILAAFLYSWRRYVVKKAEYDFEDYQRNLTNSLAHDLKTPLMAMSGYTENIMEGNLSEEEKQEYLRSILDNIAYSDRIITNALELDKMSMSEANKKEKIDLCELADRITGKYSLMLDERNISVNINGSAVIEADRPRMETIMENLVSNAVKYTPENGKITINADKKSLSVINTVEEKIDVKELKKPFVKGEKSRSGKGSGLGLAIADTAAGICGAKLIVSCSDNEFTAVLKF